MQGHPSLFPKTTIDPVKRHRVRDQGIGLSAHYGPQAANSKEAANWDPEKAKGTGSPGRGKQEHGRNQKEAWSRLSSQATLGVALEPLKGAFRTPGHRQGTLRQ